MKSFNLPGSRPQDNRIAAAQIEALFDAVTFAVFWATAGAAAIVLILRPLGVFDATTGFHWLGYISVCALTHIGLRQAYIRANPAAERWRSWALWFTAVCLAEGVGWGWASVDLVVRASFDCRLLVVVSALGVAAASIPAFSPYLPAFLAFIVPATLPYALFGMGGAHSPVEQASRLFTLVYVPALIMLGIRNHRTFIQIVDLRIRAEELAVDLGRQTAIAQQANLAKSTFLAAASHDLRQPLHALSLFVGALRGVAMPAQGQELLEQIELSTNAMDGLFTALLDISRLDAGVVEVRRRAFDIKPLLDRICRDLTPEAAAKGLRLNLRSGSVIVETDPVLMERIIRNLVSNALRYTDHGRVVIATRRRQHQALIQVWDTGRGIPAQEHDRVFQEYYQLGNLERDRTKGLGLGLAIVRRLTNLLDFELKLRSQPGKGSCFEIAIAVSDREIDAAGPEVEEFSGALAQGFIAVIDDEPAIRQAMSSLLTGWGYTVAAAGSGAEAIELLSRFAASPDLVICDYRLRDGENGIEIIERLRLEFNEAIPAMLITGDTAPDRLLEAQASGLLLLHKPLPNGKLRAAVVNLLRKPETNP